MSTNTPIAVHQGEIDLVETPVKPETFSLTSVDTDATTPSPAAPGDSFVSAPTPHSDDGAQDTGLRRMKILMMDKATPLVLYGSEIIGSAWERLGGDKMVQVDYVKINIRGTQIPVPVLVPVTFFGVEIANVQKWIDTRCEALTLIIEEKASLVVSERDHLPSYLRLEEMNLENAKKLCRQQLAAAQMFVECKREHAHENVEWIRQIIADSIRNQYQEWKLLSDESTDRITDFFRQVKEQATAKTESMFSSEDFVQGKVNEAIKVKANAVFARVMEDEVVQRIVEIGQDAKMQFVTLSSHLTGIKKQAYQAIDFEMISFTRDYLQHVLHTARETFEPHMHGEVIQIVMFQTSMILTFMKRRIDDLLDKAELVSGCNMSYLKELIQNVPLFDEQSSDVSKGVAKTEKESDRPKED